MPIKRLFFDIETSFNVCGVFSIGQKVSLGYESILQERAIICICYKWEHEKEVHSLWWNRSKNDKALLGKFIKVANRADELVAHNGDNFDLKWIRTRCYFHDIPMFPSYTTVDTLKFSRSHFRFNSNRLDYISKFGGSKGKDKTEWSMWVNITMNNDQADLAKMVKYCKRDVLEVEGVFKKMKNYLPAKSNVKAKKAGDPRSCPECGSERVIINGYKITAAGVKKAQYQCKGCGKYHISK